MSERLSIIQHVPGPSAPKRHRHAAAALALSLVIPGAGHLYAGKRGAATWTFGTFAAAAALAAWLGAPLAFLTFPLPIYIFACLDAFLTTQEANAGRDCLPNGNPRIAFILNLMTGGFGYFYLGERKLGMIVFLVSRFLTPVLGPASWAAQLFLAMHAFSECKRLYRTSLSPTAAG